MSDVVDVVVLIGPPGGGKGTNQKAIVDHGFFPFEFSKAIQYVSSIRHAIAERVRDHISRGVLIPHHLVLDIFEQYLREVVPQGTNIVFDGFPREESQVNVLFSAFHVGYRFKFVVIEVADEICLARNNERREKTPKEDRRPDSDSLTHMRRLAQYGRLLPPMISRIKSLMGPRDSIVTVDGSRNPSEVLNQILELTNIGELV